MTRWWTERLAVIADVLGLPLFVLLVLLAFVLAAIAGALWYFWPAWWPRSLPRFSRRRSRRDRSEPEPDEFELDEPVDVEELPDLPVTAFLSLADRLAAEARFAEAVRERLRAIVRDLVDHEVVTHMPGWTVTELAAAATAARPALSASVGEAGVVFSDIWYGLQPATREHDDRMRALTADVHTALAAAPAPTGGRR